MFVLRADYSRPAWYAGSNQWGTLQLRWMVGQAVYGCGIESQQPPAEDPTRRGVAIDGGQRSWYRPLAPSPLTLEL
jgi:hypothetical protein